MTDPAARPVTELPRNLPVGAERKTAAAVRRLRANFVFGALLVLFAGLVGRLLTLQAVEGAYFRGLVSNQERKVRRARSAARSSTATTACSRTAARSATCGWRPATASIPRSPARGSG